MSLFRIVKYSSILFYLGKYKIKLFRVIAVLLFAGITSLLYSDVAAYLQEAHPGIVIYALIAKIFIVYGSFAFILWQFRPEPSSSDKYQQSEDDISGVKRERSESSVSSPLSALEDVSQKSALRSRYEGVLEGNGSRSDSVKKGDSKD
jgi:hypothetical protein